MNHVHWTASRGIKLEAAVTAWVNTGLFNGTGRRQRWQTNPPVYYHHLARDGSSFKCVRTQQAETRRGHQQVAPLWQATFYLAGATCMLLLTRLTGRSPAHYLPMNVAVVAAPSVVVDEAGVTSLRRRRGRKERAKWKRELNVHNLTSCQQKH